MRLETAAVTSDTGKIHAGVYRHHSGVVCMVEVREARWKYLMLKPFYLPKGGLTAGARRTCLSRDFESVHPSDFTHMSVAVGVAHTTTHRGRSRTFFAASAMGIVDPYPGKCATCGMKTL